MTIVPITLMHDSIGELLYAAIALKRLTMKLSKSACFRFAERKLVQDRLPGSLGGVADEGVYRFGDSIILN